MYKKIKQINFIIKLFLIFLAFVYFMPGKVHATSTWTQVVSDSFNRSDSTTVGNNWTDMEGGVASISANTLILKSKAPATGTSYMNSQRLLRQSSESDLDQRIDGTFTLNDTSSSIAHGLVLRAHSDSIGGYALNSAYTGLIYHNGQIKITRIYRGVTMYPSTTGTSFTPVTGHSYTASFSAVNIFPTVLTLTVTDNNTSTQVASVTFSDYAYAQGNNPKDNMSLAFFKPGLAGVVLDANANNTSISFTNITTYTYTQSSTLTAPSAIGGGGGFYNVDNKFYLTTPNPTGGTTPYTIRWYRGSGNFSPPTGIDGSGAGTGTYVGSGTEVTDSNAPSGVSNFSIAYRAVYFDSGSNATTGIVGPYNNLNSPSAKKLASIVYVGDSITYGLQTSTGGPSKSPGSYADTALKADTAITNNWILPINPLTSIANTGLPAHTSSDISSSDLLRIIAQAYDQQANVISLMIGANDSKDSVATTQLQYKSNIQTFISAISSAFPNAKFVLNKTTWFKPDNGYGTDFSTASLARLSNYFSALDQLANGTSIVVGTTGAYNEVQTYGWTGTTGVNNPSNATTSYPPAPTSGKSYLTDGLHPYDGGAQMISTLEWYPNIKNALLSNFTAAYDVTSPTVSITSPTNNAFVSGSSVSISASASDNIAVTGVQFKLDSTSNIGTEKTSSPYSVTWDTSSVSDGNHTLTAQAHDAAGNYATSSAITVKVDNTAPTTSNSTIDTNWHSSVTVTLTCSDGSGSGCANTYYTTNGTTPTTSSSQGNSITLSSNGTYTIKYFSVDAQGNQESVKTAANVVKIDSTAPSIPGTPSTTSPTSSNSQTWTWTAATDALSGIANYMWRITDSVGNAVMSGTTSATNVVTNLTSGIYNFFVKAVDNAGNNGTESTSTVTVQGPTPTSMPFTKTPLSTWNDSSGNTVTFGPAMANNVETGDQLPTFTFTQANGNGEGISKYQIIVSSPLYGDILYLDDIRPESGNGTDTLEDDTRYERYDSSSHTITVRSKDSTHQLDSGAYKWKVKAISNSGGSLDSETRVLRVQSKQAIFSSNTLAFPITIMTIGNTPVNISTQHGDSIPTRPILVSSTTPTFYGITNSDSHMKLTLVNHHDDENYNETFNYTIDANSESRFGINVTPALTTGTYKVMLSATNDSGDYVELPSFMMTVGKAIPQITNTAQATIPPVENPPQTDPGLRQDDEPARMTTPQPQPQIQPKPKSCFLWIFCN